MNFAVLVAGNVCYKKSGTNNIFAIFNDWQLIFTENGETRKLRLPHPQNKAKIDLQTKTAAQNLSLI